MVWDCQTIVSYQVAETGPTYAQFLKTNVRPLQYMFPIADVFEVVSGDLIMGEAHSVFHTTLTVNRPIRVIRLGAFFFRTPQYLAWMVPVWMHVSSKPEHV